MIRKTFHGPEYFEAAIQRAGSLETALRQSSVYEYKRIIEELLFPYSIEVVEAMDELDDEDAAQRAALGSFKAMMDVYLRHGGDPTLDLKGYTLIDLDAKPDVPVVEYLLQCGARPDVVDPLTGCSPLHWACAYCEDTETWLKLFFKVPLLDLNVRTQYPGGYTRYDAKDDSRSTPLHFAQTASAALLLLEHGAFVNSFDRLRWTPLFDAIRETSLYPGESIKIMRALLEHEPGSITTRQKTKRRPPSFAGPSRRTSNWCGPNWNCCLPGAPSKTLSWAWTRKRRCWSASNAKTAGSCPCMRKYKSPEHNKLNIEPVNRF
jgi:hypothetical protein